MEAAQYPIVLIPFNGKQVSVKIRELTQAQIMACGELSLIETFEDRVAKNSKKKLAEILKYSEVLHKLAEASLVSPTYKEILDRFKENELRSDKIDDIKKSADELKQKLEKAPAGPQRRLLEDEIDMLKIKTELFLPDDFLSFLSCYALGVNKSDIKKLSEDILIEAAALAEKGHDNPHDHIDGAFSAFNKYDIDKRAWYLLSKFREEQKGGVKEALKIGD